jgi:hypothetical protein
MSAHVRVYPADAVLAADGFLLSVDTAMRPCGRSLSARTHKKNKNKNKIWLLAAGKEKKKMFGFRFSIPKIPKILELRKLRGRSREKKKVFLA